MRSVAILLDMKLSTRVSSLGRALEFLAYMVDTADTNFATGPAIGAADLVRHVNNRLATCPNTKFVLIGYSQGAMVTGKSLGSFERTAFSHRWAMRNSDRREQLSIASKLYCCGHSLRKVRIHEVYRRCDYLKPPSFPESQPLLGSRST